MKTFRRAALILMALAILLTAGCAKSPADQSGPGDSESTEPTEEPSKYTTWKTAREPGAKAPEPSKTIEDYTLMEGTAEEFTVAKYFVNNMIVPRDRRIEIWGTAPETQNGKVVAAEFKGLKGSGTIENGEFCFCLKGTLPASKEKGHSIIVRGAEGTEVEYEDVIVGDIWIVSGQSNADLTFFGTVDPSRKDILALYGDYLDNASADDDIRIVQQINWNVLNATGVKRMQEPQSDFMRNTKWQTAERKRVYGNSASNSFSMLGYFFAKELYTLNPDVPIGMVMGACGGAPLSLLASPEANAAFPKTIKDQSLTLNNFTIPPCGIYNIFMAPLTHVGITGMIFYQGESNALFSKDYSDALKILVEDYRVKFGSDLLFLNVQLTSYGYQSGGVNLDGVWNAVPDLRFAQSEVKIDGSISNYEVIPSYDVGWKDGDADGAHPYYKFELGQRGAKMAASLLYGVGDIEDTGNPVPSKVMYDENEVVVVYSYAGGGLKTIDGAKLQGFEVKIDGKWQKAYAVIDGNKVTIQVANAQGVRYAPELRYFSTESANLCSGTGNISVPFCAEFD